MTRNLAGIVAVGIMLAGNAVAGEPDQHTHHTHHPRPPYHAQTHHEAGHPLTVSPLAHPSYSNHYRGGFVGGGSAFGGHGRCANEGTWGWDYVGLRPNGSRIFNAWSHGHRYQGGYGAYKTDGPKPLEHLKEAFHGESGEAVAAPGRE